MRIPRHARMQRNFNGVTFLSKKWKRRILRVWWVLQELLAQLQTSWTVEQFFMRFVWLLLKRTRTASHQVYSTQLSMLFYGWISKRERRILRIQILVISNTNGNIFNRWSLFRPGALKTDLLNFRWIFQTEFVRVGVLKTYLLPRKGKGKGGGGGELEDKHLRPLFRPLVIILPIICQ